MLKKHVFGTFEKHHKSKENLLSQTTLGRDGGVKSFIIHQEN
jgi:hypothetical protein